MSVSFAGARRLIALGVASALVAAVPVVGASTAVAETPLPAAGAVLKSAVPRLTGEPARARKVGVNPGSWTPGVTFTYQWYLDGVRLAGETGPELSIPWEWKGQWLTVGVTGSLPGYAPVTRWSTRVRVLSSLWVNIYGDPYVGATLTAAAKAEPKGAKFTYQWLRDGVAIPGATKKTYLVTLADVGKLVRLRATGQEPGYGAFEVTSRLNEQEFSPVEISQQPTIDGLAAMGSVLLAKPGKWDAPDLGYQWKADGKAIKGAVWQTFVPTKAQAGKRITVTVTAKEHNKPPRTPGRLYLRYYGFARTSAATAKLLLSSAPKVSGARVVGSKLTANPGKWTSRVSLSYRWLRDGVAIPGATKKAYKFSAADQGKQLIVRVTGKRSGYATTSRDSATSVGVPPTLTASHPTVSGRVGIGEPVTVNPGSWTPGTTFTYQWFADGQPIEGGTSPVLRPNYLQADRVLSVAVTGSKAGFNPVKRTVVLSRVPATATYRVGVDIPAGTYFSQSPVWATGCEWLRGNSAVKPTTSNSLGYSVFTSEHPAGVLSRQIVSLRAGDYFFSNDCGRWTVLDQTPKLQTEFGDGDHAVGVDLAPGLWRTTDAGNPCYVEVATGFDGSPAQVTEAWALPFAPPGGGQGGGFLESASRTTNVHGFDYGTNEIEVRVTPSTVRMTSQWCGTWKRVGD